MKKSIVLLVENNTVPSDIRVWREAVTACRAGYKVAVIAPRSETFPKRYEIIDGVEIFRHAVWRGKGSQIDQLLEYVTALFWECLLCCRLFLQRRFDLLHAANPPDHVFALAAILRPLGVKYVFDHHDLAPELYSAKYGVDDGAVLKALRIMERLSCVSAAAIVSTNQSYKDHVVRAHGVNESKVFVVRNDPEVPEDATDAQPDEGSGAVIKIAYVGAINVQDGVRGLVDALDQLSQSAGLSSFSCTVVGDGDDLECVRRLVAEKGLDDNVRFTGYIHDRLQVHSIIREADVCVEPAPSSAVNDKSTFIKVMEYMAAGKPIVAFDLPETRYSTADAAVLVPPGDTGAFAAALRELMRSAATRRELGRRAQLRIVHELNWERASAELLRAYEYALSH